MFGLYGGAAWGALSFRSGASYTWHDLSTSRSVAFGNFRDSLKGGYRAGTTQVFGEFGYGVRAGRFELEPFANLAYVNLHTGSFTEQGGAAALTSSGSTTDAAFTTLGLHASTGFNLGSLNTTLRSTLGWRHAFGDVTPQANNLSFASGSSPFSIAGVPIAKNAAVIDTGLDFAITPDAILGVSYNGQFGSGVSDQSIRANFSMKF
jgi:outer membrane autotransporter protein